MDETPAIVSPATVFARPTADRIWLGTPQRAALSELARGLRVQLLVGPPSSGKTTLLNCFKAQARADDIVLSARGPKDSAAALLGSLLLSADLAPWELSAIEQRNLLTVFVQQRRAQGRRVLVTIDDAHQLNDDAWEEIERLAAFRIGQRPALELLLTGSSALAPRLDALHAEFGLGDAALHELAPPTTTDLMSYVEWRLARFELSDRMTPVANQMIARMSGGRYTAVDVLCQMSLLLLRRLRLPRVDARVARQAMAMLVAHHGAKLETATTTQGPKSLDAPPQGHLVISKAGKVVSCVPLAQRMLIGRSGHNDLCLPSPYVSRHHAVIVGTPEGYYVVDLNSVNGVLLNGNAVARAVLCDHDVVTLGPYRIKVQIPGWLAHGDPFHETDSTSTAILPAQAADASNVRRIK